MRYSVLLVDNDDKIQKYLRSSFIQDSYIIHSVNTAEEALIMIASHQIDVIISEVTLPGLDGITFLKKVKDLIPSMRFLFLTSSTKVNEVINALRYGALDYLLKTSDLEKTPAVVREILNKEIQTFRPSPVYQPQSDVIKNYLISKSPSMNKVMEIVHQVADSKATVMLYGETGTGKSVMADIIHSLSPRNKKSLIKVNCAAIPEQLLESELFGYEKGAFTGAVTTKPGRFELANGGTIFLDEIGDISPFMQVKLLRVLQEKEFEHLGGTKTIKVDVRVITATNKNLFEMVKKGTFREDLYYRLNVVPVTLPPLRERREDIKSLIEHFLINAAENSGVIKKNISSDAMDKLVKYDWPGNIRELENAVERCVVLTAGSLITSENLPTHILKFDNSSINFLQINTLSNIKETTEMEEIKRVLTECEGNKTKAAELLGISRRSLHRKLAKFNFQEYRETT